MIYWEYIYYRLYKFYTNHDNTNDPEFKALALLVLWLIIYLALIGFILFKLGIHPDLCEPKILGPITALILFGGNYWLLMYDDKAEQIRVKFDQKQVIIPKWKGRLILISYFFIPIIFVAVYFTIYKLYFSY